MINRGVPGMDPGKSSWEGTSYSWLTGSMAGTEPKNTRVNMGMLFVGLKYQKTFLGHNHKTMLFMGA